MEKVYETKGAAVIKKIVLTGPESTGKTTLADKLAKHFQTVWVPEYLREFFDLHQGVKEEDISHVANTQIQRENEAEKTANNFLFCDTDLLSSIVYHQIYFHHVPEWMNQLMEKRKVDLYLLLGTDVPWIPDPQRDRPEMRDEIYSLFEKELINRKLNFEKINGDYEQRFQAAIKFCQDLQ